MPELDEFVSLHHNGRSSTEILKAMNDRGSTITEAIKASMQLFGIGLGDAKSLLSSHPSWHPIVEAAQPLHDELIQAFEMTAEGSQYEGTAKTNR